MVLNSTFGGLCSQQSAFSPTIEKSAWLPISIICLPKRETYLLKMSQVSDSHFVWPQRAPTQGIYLHSMMQANKKTTFPKQFHYQRFSNSNSAFWHERPHKNITGTKSILFEND